MMDSIEILRRAHEKWKPYESISSKEVETALQFVWNNPSREADLLFQMMVNSFDQNSDIFWLDEAIKYAQRAYDKTVAQSYLEEILTQHDRFDFIGSSMGSAALFLGKVTDYPNKTLMDAMKYTSPSADEVDKMNQRFLNSRAFGGHIASATDFTTGLEAARRIESTGEEPSVELAEKIISDWKTKQSLQV